MSIQRYLFTLIGLFQILLISSSSYAEEEAPKESEQKTGTYGGMSAFGEFEASTSGAKINFGLGFEFFSHLDMRAGMGFFVGNSINVGIDVGARLKLPVGDFAPFVGLGGYWAENQVKCALYPEDGNCKPTYVNAGYLELGTHFQDFSLFFRNYQLRETGRKDASIYFIGIGYIIKRATPGETQSSTTDEGRT